MAQECQGSGESKVDNEQIDNLDNEQIVNLEEFAHPKHAHTLKLVELPPDHEESLCNICFHSCKEYKNIYACEICKFAIHVSCTRGIEERKLIQGCHNQRHHSLIHQKRLATFPCDACGKKEDTEPSYQCTECQLWIHQSCSSLESKIKHGDHEHKLTLEFLLPERFKSFKLSCEVCGKKLHFAYWFYYCGRCSFFVHVKCAGQKRRVAEDNIETFPKLNLALLPEGNESTQLIVRFLEQNGMLKDLNPSQLIDNFQHNKTQHPLYLLENTNGAELVCDGCIGSIVDHYYYSCQDCSYFLHVTCSKLPRDLELYHPFHPEHQLCIKRPEYCYSVQQCSHCKLDTNGWWFECTESTCEFRLDMKCTLLPKAIAHKSHRHPLSRISVSNADCSACGISLSGYSSYCCEACGFYLGNDCALLPPTATHKRDEHPLSLIFLPFIYHQDEILCEICETFAHPKNWLYHCEKCDQFFHPRCIPRHGPSRNIKCGGTIQIAEHSLKLVEKGNYKSQCGVCLVCLDQKNALLCIACNLHICCECACNKLEEKKMESKAIPPCNKTLGICLN